MEKYLKPEICKKCGGQCCKNMGCHISPDDIKEEIEENAIRRLLDTGYISIDYWECAYDDFDVDFQRGYYLRIRNSNSPICDASWGGKCILLTESGCPLDFEKRPKGARMLAPSEEHPALNCVSGYTKKDCVKDWLPYHTLLEKMWNLYF